MHRANRVRAPGAVVALALAAAGCSVFLPNNREMLSAQAHLASGDAPGALAALDPHRRDDLCAKLDRATILGSMGRAQESNAEFDRALDQIRGYEDRALVSAREVGRGTTSLIVNDKTREYQGAGYEKVLVHTFKARNYLLLGDVEAALVEMRNANMRQDAERKRHQDEIDRGNREARSVPPLGGEIDRQFRQYDGVLHRVSSAYQNPFATWLSGVVYELNGQPDDAFIDYEKAYRMVPNPVVGADLARLAAKLHRDDALRPLGLAPARTPEAPGNTLVIVDDGFAPHRVELKLPIPEPDTLLWVAVPMSRPVPSDLGETQVLASDGSVLGETRVLVDVEAMSMRDLRDRYPAIVMRQLARAAGKAAAAHAATEELGVGGFLLTTAFNAITEQADLRTWYALPRSIHVARVTLPEGATQARLRFLGVGSGFTREFTAPVVRVGPHLNLVMVRYLNGSVMASAPPAQRTALDAGRKR